MKGSCKVQLCNICCGLLSPVSGIIMVWLLHVGEMKGNSVKGARRNLTQDGNSESLFWPTNRKRICLFHMKLLFSNVFEFPTLFAVSLF